MKVAILTLCTNNNYGNRLQNYALQKFLSIYIETVDTIWFEKNHYLPELPTWNWKLILKCILRWKNAYIDFKYNYVKECIREYNIKKFSNKYIKIKYDYKIRNNLNEEYDYFIVGSDQVWNPHYEQYYNEKFLKFADKKKRISYAASFGVTDIDNIKTKKIFQNNLIEMKNISVREVAGAKLIEKLIGIKVEVVVDPTILLSKEEWQKIEMVPEWYNGEKYILTYFLGNPSPIIKSIAKKNNWKIYNLMDKNDFDLYTSRVEEFVYLIDHAQLVATDSFHACVFSILMNTPFLVVNRQQKGVADMISRIDTLMELFGYQDRYIVNGECNLSDEKILNMDFSNVKAIQEREIERSTVYMKKALNLE